MILTDLPKGTTLYRAHTPRWAARPMSGAGAALKGGRFNREGVEALYLSLEVLTALRDTSRPPLSFRRAPSARTWPILVTWWTCGSSTEGIGMSFGAIGARTGATGSSSNMSSRRLGC
nr:RES domain-containing protein [Caballeronia grimmiae]